jgi:hypothetical protein
MQTIVERALEHTVADIGQLTPEEHRELSKAVKNGMLSKGKGGPYPVVKTVYARRGFDFAAARQLHIDYAMYLDSLDPQLQARRRATVVFVNPVQVYHA